MRVNGTDLGKVIGVSSQRIAVLENKRVIFRDKDKLFNLSESVCAYATMLKKAKSEGDIDYDKARARKMTAQAEKEEIELAKRKGSIVDIEDVVDIVKQEYAVTRQKIFALPNKLAMDVLSCETAQEVQAMIEKAVNEALSELNYDAELEDEPEK